MKLKIFNKTKIVAVILSIVLALVMLAPILANSGYLLFLDDVAISPWENRLQLIFITAGGYFTGFLLLDYLRKHYSFRVNKIVLLLLPLFYVCNPFVYHRIFVGHLTLLSAYVLLPVLLISIWECEKHGKLKLYSLFATVNFFMMLFDSHFIFINSLIILCWTTSSFVLRSKLKKTTALMLVHLLLLIPLYILQQGLLSTVEAIDYSHFSIFATQKDANYGLLGNLLALHGFWRENYEVTSIKVSPVWWLMQSVLWFLVLLGMYKAKKVDKKLSTFLVALFLGSLVLAAGIAHPVSEKITYLLYKAIPFFTGMRETQKFLAVMPLVYLVSLFFSYQVMREKLLQAKIKTRIINLSLLGTTIIIISNAVFFLKLFYVDIKLVTLPASWKFAQQELSKTEKKLIELPFYIYHKYPFAKYTTASLAKPYFGDKVVSSSYFSELGSKGVYSDFENSWRECYQKNSVNCALELMRQYKIEYVLYVFEKTDDNFAYSRLLKRNDIEEVYKDSDAALLKLRENE